MKQETITLELPATWLPAIAGKDYSGLSIEDRKDIAALFILHDLWDRTVNKKIGYIKGEYNGQPRTLAVYQFFPNADLIEGSETPDEMNPEFLFNNTYTPLLAKIASGEIDAQALALLQLERRGRDAAGAFVGFKKTKTSPK